MAIRPCCCGCSLQSATKWIAILQIVFSAFALGGLIISVGIFTVAYTVTDHIPNTNEKILETYNGTADSVSEESADVIKQNGEVYINFNLMLKSMLSMSASLQIVALYVVVFTIVMAVELLKGAKERNVWRCNAWLNFHIANFILSIVVTPVLMMLDSNGPNGVLIMVSVPIGLLIDVYFMWIVYSFMQQVRSEQSSNVVNSNTAVQWNKA